MSDNKLITGLFFKDKHENAPDFVICKGSIKVADFAAWLAQQSGEWVNFDLKRSREGKLYPQVDDWKPNGAASTAPQGGTPARQRQAPAEDAPFDDTIPF